MNKIIRACVALAAFAAFAVLPATASANNEATLTAPTGTTLAAGSNIIATNLGTTKMFSVPNAAEGGSLLVECATATITGNLHENTHARISGNITSAKFSGTPGAAGTTHCKGSLGNVTVHTTSPPVTTNGLPWCIESTNLMATDRINIRGNSCTSASRPINFLLTVATIFGTVSCEYSRSAAISGVYTTHPSAAQVSIPPAAGVGRPEFVRQSPHSSGLCPEKGYLEMTFGLYRDVANHTSNPIYIDKVSTIK